MGGQSSTVGFIEKVVEPKGHPTKNQGPGQEGQLGGEMTRMELRLILLTLVVQKALFVLPFFVSFGDFFKEHFRLHQGVKKTDMAYFFRGSGESQKKDNNMVFRFVDFLIHKRLFLHPS